MSDTTDDKKSGAGRLTLGLKSTVETGQVRQSMGQGRTNTVVVERKRKRMVKGQNAAPQAEAPKPAPAPAAVAPKANAAGSGQARVLTEQERKVREGVLQAANERAELEKVEAKKRAALEAERAVEQEAVDAKAEEEAQVLIEEQEKRRKEDAKKKAEEDAASQAEKDEAEKAVATQAAQEAAEVAEVQQQKDPSGAKPKPVPTLVDRDERKKTAKPTPRRNDDKRRQGKLTISAALSGGGRERQRSMAALKRKREKEKRALQGGFDGPTERKVREVVVPEGITVGELAIRMAEKGNAVIKVLMGMDVMATINQTLDQDTAELVVGEFGHTIKRVSDADVEIGIGGAEDKPEDLLPRAPVVTIMGHVDHGKTSLLDALRKTDVVAGEAGGITQHIGAYQVVLGSGDKITFLDTPGHAAFTEMRSRGAHVTDIAILVVAADDGVMPQTIESISHAKAAGVPIIVAINKMDREGADPTRVRTELLQHEIIVEDMSGDVQDVPVSAINGEGMDALQEAILLQAELLELKANPNRAGEGAVIEAKLDKGRGPVATVLIKRGTLRVGDIFVAGAQSGRVRALFDERGNQLKEAGPSSPVEVLGLNGTPNAGDDFVVVPDENQAREISEYRQGVAKRKSQAVAPTSLEEMFSQVKAGQAVEFPILIKADVQGSVEAISQSLNNLSTDDIKVRVLHSGVGGITESDIALAQASNAPVIGFNVRANAQARDLSEKNSVVVEYFSIIYNLIDSVKSGMLGELGPEIREVILGSAEVLDVFNAGKGKAAGCRVTDGLIKRVAKARLLRDDTVIYEGDLSSLRRFKDDVDEVKNGLECGMGFENYNDIKVGDFIEVYELQEHERFL